MGHVVGVARAAVRAAIRRDPDSRWKLLKKMSRWLCPDFKITDPYIDWHHDAEFTRFLVRFDELRGLNSARHWNLYQLLRLSLAVEGDTAELGVFEGAGSWLICNAHRGRGKAHLAFDSFAGLSQPGSGDGGYWEPGDLARSLELVQKNLREFTNVEYFPGWIPERFAEVSERRFSFVHIDVDLEQPTRDSIEFFYPRTNPGGVIVCDDYGSSLCPGATQSIDAFLADKPESMLALSSGGGFMIRGVTSPAFELSA